MNSLPELGGRLTELQKKESLKIIEYFKHFEVEKNVVDAKKPLIVTAHGIAFTMRAFTATLTETPECAMPYLNQLKSDTIQILQSTVVGGKRALHLYERASIEDFLRYIYFFDHKIEHILLQTYPTRTPNFDTLIDWLQGHPQLSPYKRLVSEQRAELTCRYAELSRTVHGTRLADQQIVESLRDLTAQILDVEGETKLLKKVYQSIFFLLSTFHIHHYRKLSLDEKTVICQYLSKEQKSALSGIRN